LDSIFRNRGIRSVVVLGLVTEGCVESTVEILSRVVYEGSGGDP
jgi:nicotinamidase-related amidase